ncbi:hypothetical protein P775_00415 [Puniceibacterium antarcticum]|uniref:Transglycosylase SLT domain-containing protein n=1 Tax=Puniceibacterium antarcticum TaxID=1206336 RepID=A0A2G8RL38_9RHOB|nr:lytic transglycosylase domain-containing protein [Puniceibacterium antarcticum]PIL22222.1 hypothetical protein P775_00415 [Puniceibacterium antarcticum]
MPMAFGFPRQNLTKTQTKPDHADAPRRSSARRPLIGKPLGGCILALLLVSCALAGAARGALAEPMRPTAFRAVAESCAPGVAPALLNKLVAAESGFEPLAIGVNGPEPASYAPRTAQEAVRIARELMAQDKSIDMGLGQINNVNLDWLGLTPRSVFDVCRNLTAAATVLRDGFERARESGATKEDALRKALSAYNTGSFTRGVHNGYVARVLGEVSPARPSSATPGSPSLNDDSKDAQRWNVFGTSSTSGAQVFQ